MLKLKLSEIEEKNVEDLIIGLKRCPKKDLLIIFNNENITEIIVTSPRHEWRGFSFLTS